MTADSLRPALEHSYDVQTQPIGNGSFANVYRATRRSDSIPVAIKISRDEPLAQARIKREIEAQAQLAHPNIMPIYDHDASFHWYAMPLARGSLTSLRPELREDDLYDIIDAVAQALKVAHGQGLIHRDISPHNILALEGSSTGNLRWVAADW